MSLLWINRGFCVLGDAGTQFAQHVDQRGVGSLEYRWMLRHRQVAKLAESAQGLVNPRFAGRLVNSGVAVLFHAPGSVPYGGTFFCQRPLCVRNRCGACSTGRRAGQFDQLLR